MAARRVRSRRPLLVNGRSTCLARHRVAVVAVAVATRRHGAILLGGRPGRRSSRQLGQPGGFISSQFDRCGAEPLPDRSEEVTTASARRAAGERAEEGMQQWRPARTTTAGCWAAVRGFGRGEQLVPRRIVSGSRRGTERSNQDAGGRRHGMPEVWCCADPVFLLKSQDCGELLCRV